MTDNNDNNNIFRLAADNSVKDDKLPQFDYVIETTDGEVDEVRGFPVFSPQYVLIMRETDSGVTFPVYMKPINLIKTFLFEEDDLDEEEELPF